MRHIFYFVLFIVGSVFAQNQKPKSTGSEVCAQIRKTQKTNAFPLSSSAHIARMNKYDVKFYWLDINLERTGIDVSGKVTIRAQVLSSPLDIFSFELHANHIIDSVIVNGQFCTINRTLGEVNANIPNPILANSSVEAVIYYHGTAPSGQSSAIGNGLSNKSSQSWGNTITWSLSQPYSAYEWWPCKQVLNDKADSSWCFITTDTSNKAASNGLLTNVVPLGSKNRHEWKSKYPIDYYLIAATVGQYVIYDIYANPQGSNPILIQNYIYNNPQTLPNFQADIDETAQMIEIFSEKYGLYPFHAEKYGHVMAPFSGGMEHQTMTSQGFFERSLTAHELGHQWFGDHVTCDSWADIWVNEGFASYSEFIVLSEMAPTQTGAWLNNAHSNTMSQPDGSVYCTDTTEVNRIFNARLTYDKGGAIIHTLRNVINNDSLFFLGLKTYLNLFANKTAKGSDFKSVMQSVTGMNFDQFFTEWYYGEGYPTFTVKWAQNGSNFFIRSTQTTSASSVTPLFHLPVEYRLSRTSLPDTVVRVFHGQSIENYVLQVNGNVTNIYVDPKNYIINDLGSIQKDASIITALDKQSKTSDWKIYPNPNAGKKLQVEVDQLGKYQLSILDVTGKQILSKEWQAVETKFEWDIELSKGIYLVQLEKENVHYFKKLIIE